LSTTERYFLKKTDRLKSRKAIEILYKSGKNFSVFPLRIQYLVTQFEPGIKAGFSAPSKNFKKATDRNKIKRLLKEAYRLQKNEIAKHPSLGNNGLYVFFIYTGKEIPNYDFIYEKTGLALQKLVKQLDWVDKTDDK
jgi:ribonuclease P protein component